MTPDEFRDARNTLGLTQRDLGEILGLTDRTIRNIETGQTRIKPPIEREIARLLAER